MKKIERVEFNWDTTLGSPERAAWLKENHDKPITLEQYIEHEKSLPHNHTKASRCRSNAKKRYFYMKARFGFFGGSDEA